MFLESEYLCERSVSLYVGQQIIIYVVQHVVCSPICISEKHHQC